MESLYEIVASAGQRIQLVHCKNGWKAQVNDKRFPGFNSSFAVDVCIESGYSVDQVAQSSEAYQRRHVELLQRKGETGVVFIGSLGLKGGGCSYGHSVYICGDCGFICPADCCPCNCGHMGPSNHDCFERQQQQNTQELCNVQAQRNSLQVELRNLKQEAGALVGLKSDIAQQEQISSRLESERRSIIQELDGRRQSQASAHNEKRAERRQVRVRQSIIEGLEQSSNSLLEDEIISESEEESENTESQSMVSVSNVQRLQEPHDCSREDDGDTESVVSNKSIFDHVARVLSTPSRGDSDVLLPDHEDGGHSSTSDSAYVSNGSGSDEGDATQCYLSSSVDDIPALSGAPEQFDFISWSSRKACSFESLNRGELFTEFVLEEPSISPVNRFLTKYGQFISASEYIVFYKQIGQHIDMKLSGESDAKYVASLLEYFEDKGIRYPMIIKHDPASQWLRLSLFQDTIRDLEADPSTREKFYKLWESIGVSFNDDQQTELLQAIWRTSDTVELSLVKVNDMLELITATNTKGGDLAYDEPLLTSLNHLRKQWLMASLADVQQLKPFSESYDEISDMLASSHLSMSFILEFIGILGQLEGELKFNTLLEIIKLANRKQISEAILSATLYESDSRTADIVEQWIISLNCQMLTMQLAQLDSKAADLISPALRKKILQKPSVAALIEKYLGENLETVVEASEAFVGVLDVIYTFQVGPAICEAVFQGLCEEPPERWLRKCDQIIVHETFPKEMPEDSAEETMQKIAQLTPSRIQDPLAVSQVGANGDKYSYERKVAKALENRIRKELRELIGSYNSVLYKLSGQLSSLKSSLETVTNQKKKIARKFHEDEEQFRKQDKAIDSELRDLDNKVDGYQKRIREEEEIKRRKEAELKAKEDELRRKLGQQVSESASSSDSKTNSSSKLTKSKNQLVADGLRSKMNSLYAEQKNLRDNFLQTESVFLEETAKLEREENRLEDEIEAKRIEVDDVQKKVTKLYSQDATKFSDESCYNEVLKNLSSDIVQCSGMSPRYRSHLGPIKFWIQQDIDFYMSITKTEMSSSECFSNNIGELIAVMVRAAELVQQHPTTENQILQLLTLLYPAFERDTRISNPQVVSLFAAVSASHLGQISLLTDSDQLPIKEYQIEQNRPLFEFLGFTMNKRKNLRPKELARSNILYGSSADFCNQPSNLLAVTELQKRRNAVNTHYNAASILMQSTDPLLEPSKKKVIADWDASEVRRWARYIRSHNVNDSQSATSFEYVAVVRRAIKLTFGELPSPNQLWAVLISLDEDLDENRITARDREGALVIVMSAAVLALQIGQADITTSCDQIPIQVLEKFGKFLSMLNLKVASVSLPEDETLDSEGQKQDASSEQSRPVAESEKAELISQSDQEPDDFGESFRILLQEETFTKSDRSQTPTEASSSDAIHGQFSPGTSSAKSKNTKRSWNLNPKSFSATKPAQGGNELEKDGTKILSPLDEINAVRIEREQLAPKQTQLEPEAEVPDPTHDLASYGALKQAYEVVMTAYSGLSVFSDMVESIRGAAISSWDVHQVKAWSEHMADTYEPNSSNKAELIAGVKRAVELANGFSPRTTQLLTLICLLSETGKGRLAQVNTGEGKSLIVAMFSAFHALQGKHVDVITTSTELSIPEVKRQKDFFAMLNLTVADNSPSSDKRATYEANVVYGTANDFEGDILRSEFLGDQVRGKRRIDIVLVDEVDSLLFDNRSHSVRLSLGNPGMQHLNVVLAVIWSYLDFIETNNELPESDVRQFLEEKTKARMQNLLRELNADEEIEYRDYLAKKCAITYLEEGIATAEDQVEREKKLALHVRLNAELKEHPFESHPIIDIPVHLRAFARTQIPHWIKNAINARYVYEKDKHYRVDLTKSDPKIEPIQYNETGVIQTGMVWSDGLNQFLQIKEGLAVDPESVSTNFISNVGFFKRYGNNIFGLTGTLGEKATQDFLSDLYNVDFVIVPPHKPTIIVDNEKTPYLCKELAPTSCPNSKEWFLTIVQQSIYHAKQQRAVLLILKYIREVKFMEKLLKKHYRGKISMYTGETEHALEESNIDSGEIIIATNIAGRGTDLKTTASVEANGGLYVAVTFLPENYRVEMQNVGRTARAGKRGMAQLIIAQKEPREFKQLKMDRSRREAAALEKAKGEAKKMLIQDTLFQSICQLTAEYLPSVYDCENLRLSRVLAPKWAAFLKQREYADKTDKIEKHAAKARDVWGSKVTESKLDMDDQQSQSALFDRKLESKISERRQRCKKKLFGQFIRMYPNTPKPVLDSIERGVPLVINKSELATKYNWGLFERKAVEERWALWLKSKHIETLSHDEVLPIIASFADEFSAKIIADAQKDLLIENPFYFVLKGNELISESQASNIKRTIKEQLLDKAVVNLDRAINLDRTFSVNALYNKARAFLSYEDNRGLRQGTAYAALQESENLIKTVYRTNLLTFHSLVAAVKAQSKTIEHIQQLVNLIGQQENYIKKARNVIEEARKHKKERHVKLSDQLIRETFPPTNDERLDSAIRGANGDGLTHLFTITEVPPTPWWSIVGVALIGLAQVTVGCCLLVAGGSGLAFIKEGISDLITAVKSAVTGSFEWATWAIQKAISLAVTLITAGIGGVKDGFNAIKDATKDLVAESTKVAVDGVAGAVKVVATEIGKAVTHEVLFEAAKWHINNHLLTDVEALITEKVETALEKAFNNNQLIIKGLKLDKKNGNSHWMTLFVKEGKELLRKEELGTCAYMLKEIAQGVAANKVPYGGQLLKVAGIVKMIDGLANYTNDFVVRFNKAMKKHRNAILSNQQTQSAPGNTSATETQTSNLTTESVAADIELDDEDDVIKKKAAINRSIPKQTGSVEPLEANTLGASEVENLVYHFKGQICQDLIQSTQSAVLPLASAATGALTDKFFSGLDKCNENFMEKKREARKQRKLNDGVASSNQPTSPDSVAEVIESSETQTQTAEQEGQQPNPKNETKLSDLAEAFRESFKSGGPNDTTALACTANAIGHTIEIYNTKGQRVDVITNDKAKGKRVQIIFIEGEGGLPGHYISLKQAHRVTQGDSSHNTKGMCWLDAVVNELPPETRSNLGGSRGIAEKCIAQIDADPNRFNELCEQRRRVQLVNGDSLRKGGLIEWAFEDYRKAIFEGNTEQAERLKEYYHQWEIIAAKSAVIIGAGVLASSAPAGALGAIAACSTVSAILDDDLRDAVKRKDWDTFCDKLLNHVPIAGNIKQARENYAQGNKKLAAAQAIFAIIECLPAVALVKKVTQPNKIPTTKLLDSVNSERPLLNLMKDPVARNILPNKMNYLFGKATGSPHNIERSIGMRNSLNSIGILDTPAGREMVQNQLIRSYYNCASTPAKLGRVSRELFIVGPVGRLRATSIWDKEKFVTLMIKSKKQPLP